MKSEWQETWVLHTNDGATLKAFTREGEDKAKEEVEAEPSRNKQKIYFSRDKEGKTEL